MAQKTTAFFVLVLLLAACSAMPPQDLQPSSQAPTESNNVPIEITPGSTIPAENQGLSVAYGVPIDLNLGATITAENRGFSVMEIDGVVATTPWDAFQRESDKRIEAKKVWGLMPGKHTLKLLYLDRSRWKGTKPFMVTGFVWVVAEQGKEYSLKGSIDLTLKKAEFWLEDFSTGKRVGGEQGQSG